MARRKVDTIQRHISQLVSEAVVYLSISAVGFWCLGHMDGFTGQPNAHKGMDPGLICKGVRRCLESESWSSVLGAHLPAGISFTALVTRVYTYSWNLSIRGILLGSHDLASP
jgi:hypothetical protein